jgi:hypothetical protein
MHHMFPLVSDEALTVAEAAAAVDRVPDAGTPKAIGQRFNAWIHGGGGRRSLGRLHLKMRQEGSNRQYMCEDRRCDG